MKKAAFEDDPLRDSVDKRVRDGVRSNFVRARERGHTKTLKKILVFTCFSGVGSSSSNRASRPARASTRRKSFQIDLLRVLNRAKIDRNRSKIGPNRAKIDRESSKSRSSNPIEQPDRARRAQTTPIEPARATQSAPGRLSYARIFQLSKPRWVISL